MIPRPLRVPSTRPGEWVYLRKWMTYVGAEPAFGRSNGALQLAVYADNTGWAVRCDGLDTVTIKNHTQAEKNAAALDAYLMSIGAEEVPTDEWPVGCFGDGHREDRKPFEWWQG